MMEKTDETIPSREELAVYIEEAAVSVTNNYEEAPAVLMVDDAVIGTLGNFSASIGKAKSKKTFNVSAIAASALSGRTVLRYRSMFPENKSKILYIDTEQGRHHCQQVLKRILRLAEMPDDKVPENLIMLSLRKFAPRVRLLIVEEAIGTTPDLGLVIIDGIRDFLYDINSSSESTEVISKFMQWTDDKQIHIHTVLHQNKNDEHARGHIGTELNNKAETILQVEVDKEDKAISVVEAVHIRDRDFEPFAFRINEDVLPELVEPYLSKEKKSGRPTGTSEGSLRIAQCKARLQQGSQGSHLSWQQADGHKGGEKLYSQSGIPLLSTTLLYCRGVYIRIKQSRQEIIM